MRLKLGLAALLIVTGAAIVFTGNVFGDSKKRATIAASLFKLESSKLNYDYNAWGNPDPSKAGKCLGYDGGHSGIDIQTKDKSTSKSFYALSGGKVITAGGGSYNTIAVYDSANNRTVLYLHASKVNVKVDQKITAGTLLGNQGSTGAGGAVHVHVEVRTGSKTGPACGATTTINPETVF